MSVRWKHGDSLLELLLAIAVFVISISVIAVLFMDASTTGRRGLEREKAIQLAEEGMEAVRSIRDQSFANLSVGTKGLLLTSTSTSWTFSGISDTRDGYVRTIQIASPSADVREVTSTVSWDFTPTVSGTMSFAETFTNWQQISAPTLSWARPVVSSHLFLTGTADTRAVTAAGTTVYIGRLASAQPELVVVDASSSTNPLLIGNLELGTNRNIQALDISGSILYAGSTFNTGEIQVIDVSSSTNPVRLTEFDLVGSADVFGLAVQGNLLYVARGTNSGSATFQILNISTPAAPVVLGGLNRGTIRDVAFSTMGPSYAHIASANTASELNNVSSTVTSAPSLTASSNLPGSGGAWSVAVSGTVAYVGTLNQASNAEFFVVNVSNPAVPVQQGSFEVTGNVRGMRLANNLLYLATASSTAEFMVLDAADPNNPIRFSKLDLTGAVTTWDVMPTATAAYVVSASDDLYVIEPTP